MKLRKWIIQQNEWSNFYYIVIAENLTESFEIIRKDFLGKDFYLSNTKIINEIKLKRNEKIKGCYFKPNNY